jgi:hypothetical protein
VSLLAAAASPAADLPTVAGIALLVYFVATVTHEGLGHGLTCTVVRGRLVSVSSVDCECDYEGVTSGGVRAVEAAGTLANLAAGLVFLAAFLLAPGGSPTWRYVLWLAAMVNLLQAGGYLAISPVAGFGDWGQFLGGVEPKTAWKLGLTAAGVAITGFALYVGQRELVQFTGAANPARSHDAWKLTLLPYALGCVVSCAVALRNPVKRMLAATSAGAATLGGTACLVWIGFLTGKLAPAGVHAPATIGRSPLLIGLGLAALALWALVLAPGVSPPARRAGEQAR